MAQAFVQPEDTVRLKYTGRNVGAITLVSPTTGQSYQLGNNPADRFQFVHPDDVQWLGERGFVAAEIVPEVVAPNFEPTAASLAALADLGIGVHWAQSVDGLSDGAVQAFKDSGISSLAAAQTMSDEELDALSGIGPATIAKVREAQA